MSSRNPKAQPDYSPGFKKLTGFRGSHVAGIRSGRTTIHEKGTYIDKNFHAGGSVPKRSPSTPFPAGPKKPMTGKH
jgi:hypothetical protein